MGHTIVAIDGPAGSGKSTAAKRVAKELGYLYIDTGAMYRALTLKAVRQKLPLDDEPSLAALAGSTRVDLREKGGGLTVYLDGEDVTDLIRTHELTNTVKHVARVPGVRARMVELQRALGRMSDSVLEGRDIGTAVFPDATFKFYLDADVRERAKRRQKDLAAAGQAIAIEDVEKDVTVRDESDMNRSVGALKKARDAVLIDTTHLTIDEVAEKVLSYIRP